MSRLYIFRPNNNSSLALIVVWRRVDSLITNAFKFWLTKNILHVKFYKQHDVTFQIVRIKVETKINHSSIYISYVYSDGGGGGHIINSIALYVRRGSPSHIHTHTRTHGDELSLYGHCKHRSHKTIMWVVCVCAGWTHILNLKAK